ncbi:MAG TPA: hypothetical protein PK955_09685, partial [Methanoregulaceae archaeon]|nr:hypothetical protein [Methanoregulaceae archaeon]
DKSRIRNIPVTIPILYPPKTPGPRRILRAPPRKARQSACGRMRRGASIPDLGKLYQTSLLILELE